MVNALVGTKVNAYHQKQTRAAWLVQVGGTVRVLSLLHTLYDDASVALARKKALIRSGRSREAAGGHPVLTVSTQEGLS